MRLQLVLAGIAAAALASAAEITVIEEIIAKVNGEIITRGDVERTRKQMEAAMREQGATGQRLQEAMAEADKNILRERIDQLLLQSKAKELNLNVDSEVAKQLADIQRKSGITDPDKFQQFVRDQTGMSYEDYKNDRKNDLLTNRVIRQEVASKITIKREEAQQYYDGHKDEFQREERVYLREILVATPPGADTAQAQKKAKDLADRGKKGEKFDDLARNNSDSPSAQQDGDIGAYEKGKLRPEIEKTVWDQPRGYVTDPINVGNGFLILKVEEHQKAGLAGFEEVLPEITNKLFNPRFNPELRRYLTQLRVNAFLEIKPGYEDSGAAPGKNTAWVDPAEIKPETITKEQVAARQRHRRLLGLVPIPGTSTQSTGTSSSR
ncbi:MAG TPA: peptidylprolyl isomerase [Bryobacteraceae bacterium]|nr:peptidylprolyl isomerase [Bryobacteraceae bacterium]